MNLVVLVVVLVAVFSLAGNESFGYTEKFDFMSKTLDRQPYICVLEPDLPDHARSIMRETRGAVDEWRNVLQSQERGRDGMEKWAIGYETIPLERQKEFDYSKCNIVIVFKPRPATNPTSDAHIVGTTQYLTDSNGKSVLITIYYLDVKICESAGRGITIRMFCYSNDVILAVQQANVVRHEIGHAFGLGHYVSDDPKVHQAWTRHGVISPSIMTPYMHSIHTQQKIMQKDVDAVRKIYGDDGFRGLEKDSMPTIKIDIVKPQTPEQKAEPKPDIPPWIKNNAKWWGDGVISDSDFIHGIQYLISQNMIKVAVSTQDASQTQEIPSWIRTTVKWWSEGKITDGDFLKGIEFLIRQGIIRV